MTTLSLTDAQIDAKASAYAREHGVSYSEALGQVVAFAESSTVLQNNAATMPQQLTDAQADAQARLYAAQHGVDYWTALRIVTQGHAASQAVASGKPANAASDMDRLIDAAATAHARATGASYAEALGYVTLHGTAHFNEGNTATVTATASMDTMGAVQTFQNQPIEIFRMGTHIDSDGNKRTFTVQDVQSMASAYDPARHEAPLTLGHPASDRPAYGWVKSLTATIDGRLLMLTTKVDPVFVEGVKSGRYSKRSASFYPPYAPTNPTPGQWYLRHVGWLGAQPPAVQGLADVNFGTAPVDGFVCFDLA